MSLTRKMLKAMGIEDEKIDQIIEAHTETTEGLKTEIANAKTAAESGTQKITELEKQIEELKNTAAANEGKNPWKVKYDVLKEEYEGYKTEEQAKATRKAKEKAYEGLLKKAGITEKRIPAVMKVSDIDTVELDEKGEIKDEEKFLTSIKSEWTDFISTESTKGAETATPPAAKGNEETGDNDAINRIISQRAELYGKQS